MLTGVHLLLRPVLLKKCVGCESCIHACTCAHIRQCFFILGMQHARKDWTYQCQHLWWIRDEIHSNSPRIQLPTAEKSIWSRNQVWLHGAAPSIANVAVLLQLSLETIFSSDASDHLCVLPVLVLFWNNSISCLLHRTPTHFALQSTPVGIQYHTKFRPITPFIHDKSTGLSF